MQFDSPDKQALQTLDTEFVISADGETAKITGEMTVTVTRPNADQISLVFVFPNGEEFIVRAARAQLLEQLNVLSND